MANVDVRPRIIHLLHCLPVRCVISSPCPNIIFPADDLATSAEALASLSFINPENDSSQRNAENIGVTNNGSSDSRPVSRNDNLGGLQISSGASSLARRPSRAATASASPQFSTGISPELHTSPSNSFFPDSCPTKSLNWSLCPRNNGHTSLYAGLRSLNSSYKNIYVGTLGPVVDDLDRPLEGQPPYDPMADPVTNLQIIEELRSPSDPSLPECHAVVLNERDWTGHYEGYCKGVLWPNFHYILGDTMSDGQSELRNWESYQNLTREFVSVACALYRPGDVFWVHDYHLLLAPLMIRENLEAEQAVSGITRDLTIGLFIHSPFPSSEVFRCLAKRSELLLGTLGASLIGFQTYSYARHFIASCTRVLGAETLGSSVEVDGRQVRIGIYPVGIDVAKADSLRRSAEVRINVMQLNNEIYPGKRLIVGHDKLDNSHGIYQKMLAYSRFLTMFPVWRSSVVLVQITTPSQKESTKLDSKISELISQINTEFGTFSHMPVVHMQCKLSQSGFFALLSAADLGLVTPIRDGMNTAAQEFIVCQREKMAPLILSEFTGTAGSLASAVHVNPWDTESVAFAINQALTMSADDRVERQRQLSDHLDTFTAQHWAQDFIDGLIGHGLLPGTEATPTPPLDEVACLSCYKASLKNHDNEINNNIEKRSLINHVAGESQASSEIVSRRLILFDYDGTLTPIAKHPRGAQPSIQLCELLTVLCADPLNTVFVISGRDLYSLESMLGHIPGLGLSGEHGCFFKPYRGKTVDFSHEIDLTWMADVVDIFEYYTTRTHGTFIEKKSCSVTWHYRLADPFYGNFQAKECQNHLESAILPKRPVEILVGKKAIEVRPFKINKGNIVKHLLQAVTNSSNTLPYDFVFCVGDDKTDEDMFKALKQYTMALGNNSESSSSPGPCLGNSNSKIINSNNTPSWNNNVWCVTIGAKTKRTSADWHLTTPQALLRVMNGWAKISSA